MILFEASLLDIVASPFHSHPSPNETGCSRFELPIVVPEQF